MENSIVNFSEKFKLFDEFWTQKIVAQMNDYHFKVVKLKGDFAWHDHEDTDETFIVIKGKLTIELENRPTIHLEQGEMFVVPKKVRHRPIANEECHILLIEPQNMLISGGEVLDRGAIREDWI